MANDIGPGTLVEFLGFEDGVEHWAWHDSGWALPAKGVVYTVRSVHQQFYPPTGHYDAVVLDEIRNPVGWFVEGVFEIGFPAPRFRPVRDDSLDIFRQAIKDAPVDDKVTETVG